MPALDNPKLLSLEQAVQEREALRAAGQSVVLTNGCFDLLHTGHLYFLQEAAKQGDALCIALNATPSVRALKGPLRPVQGDLERAYALASLTCVHRIVLFETPRLCKEIEALRPDIYVKAGDYSISSIHGEERTVLESVGATIRFLPFLEGYSTTDLIKKINAAADTL